MSGICDAFNLQGFFVAPCFKFRFPVSPLDVLCPAAEENARDDREDAGPNAEPRRGRWSTRVEGGKKQQKTQANIVFGKRQTRKCAPVSVPMAM